MSNWLTNRRTGNHFMRRGRGKIIRDSPDIVNFEYAGSVYVEDGDGSRYIVHYADGHTAEVVFTDALDTEVGYPGDEFYGVEQKGELRNVEVTWDGAVDYSDSYDGTDPVDIARTRRRLIKRYGKIAEAWI